MQNVIQHVLLNITVHVKTVSEYSEDYCWLAKLNLIQKSSKSIYMYLSFLKEINFVGRNLKSEVIQLFNNTKNCSCCLFFFVYFISYFFFTKFAHLVYTNTLQQISGVHVLYYSYSTLVIAEQPSTCL